MARPWSREISKRSLSDLQINIENNKTKGVALESYDGCVCFNITIGWHIKHVYYFIPCFTSMDLISMMFPQDMFFSSKPRKRRYHPSAWPQVVAKVVPWWLDWMTSSSKSWAKAGRFFLITNLLLGLITKTIWVRSPLINGLYMFALRIVYIYIFMY